MTEKNKQKIWNVPNALTMLRMALIPVFWYLMMSGRLYAALGVFVAASLTDIADGYIARKYDLITDFGKLMDPLADKLMVISMMTSLAVKGIAPWAALAIILAKEATMVVGGLILYQHHVVVYARWIGKIAQATVVCALISCFFHEWLQNTCGFPVHTALLWLGVALTLCALGVYMKQAIRLYREAKQKENEGES
ncbi:MAG: CDP-alcohol phosphatidyltransferase family protein [Clostridia bacterium]|nr:CDP-alcohol phosphatidyltransferase family protein [Clostridia bacterium]